MRRAARTVRGLPRGVRDEILDVAAAPADAAATALAVKLHTLTRIAHSISLRLNAFGGATKTEAREAAALARVMYAATSGTALEDAADLRLTARILQADVSSLAVRAQAQLGAA